MAKTPPAAIPIDLLERRLADLFDVHGIQEVHPTRGGYLCQNFRIETQSGRLFLKEYRNRIGAGVHEIKQAEQFFAHHGIPIVLPILDRFGREVFWFEGHWFSLFPFIEDPCPTAASMGVATAASLGDMLARIHWAGESASKGRFQRLRLWEREMFHLESVEVEQALLRKSELDGNERRVLDLLRVKKELVARNTARQWDVGLPYDTLLHGDFIYQNTFVGTDGRLTGVFDLEKTCLGPRAYECGRSLLINCFDDGFEERQFANGRAFVAAYRTGSGMGFDEFSTGVRMYYLHLVHMMWVEMSMVLQGKGDEYAPLHAAHQARIERLSTDLSGFCRAVWDAPLDG